MKLNKDQVHALEVSCLGSGILVTGAGGTGKTEFIKEFVKLAKIRRTVAVTSTTGVSALLLPGGKTVHSWAGIGLGTACASALATRIKKKSYLSNRWKTVDTIVIDEISMLSPDLFDKLEEVARIIRRNDKPFGGIQIVATGDFLQLPCVKCDKFCFEAESWDRVICRVVYLETNMRQHNPVWQSCLSSIRMGVCTDKTNELLLTRVDAKLEDDGITPTRLYSLNVDVDRINQKELENLETEDILEYEGEVFVYDKKKAFLKDRMIKDCSAPLVLRLSVGCQVILVSNLDPERGLVNGSRGVVTGFSCEELPIVKFASGVVSTIDYYIWEMEERDTRLASMEQIPLRLGYAVSIHRSQGLSLDRVEADIADVFEYGQAYVALSRVRSIDGLRLVGFDENRIKAHPRAVKFYRKLQAQSMTPE